VAQQALTEQQSDTRITGALQDVQRLVVSAYAHLPWARYLLFRVDDGATDPSAVRSWLGSFEPRVTTAAEKPSGLAINVALTAEGLARIGVRNQTMATFPRALRHGMADEYRSRFLGDTGASSPEHWAWGGPSSTPHLLLAVYALEAQDLADAAGGLVAEAGRAGVNVAYSIDSLALPNAIEHFGFTDGISQPVLAGTEWAQRTGAPKWEAIAPGEFVLGHRDESGLVSDGPMAGDVNLGLNGSYLVMRQLEQHVELFRSYVDTAATARGSHPDDVGAELVGRKRDGRSLACGAPVSGDLNDFGYEQDQDGLGCPLGAHVRRANPRNTTPNPGADAEEKARRSVNRHRIIRRGRPYGPADQSRKGNEPRGLVFIAVNADLERQFEFVQHTWLNSSTFGGLSDELDPITAEQPVVSTAPDGTFTRPALPVRHRLRGLPSFTTTRGGAYFFLPGLRALRHLASGEL
jgi:Dyp-type peroxidase family